MRSRITPLTDFLLRESSSGVLLVCSALLGLAVANSPLREKYFSILEAGFEIGSGFFYLKLTTLKIVNYVLMTIFFFVVGLEIKRELTSGHLATFRKAVIPFLAAIGGMALPAAIYVAIAGRTDLRGWGVPVATDIALAVGVLTMLGASVAPSLRTFLLGLAVIDDIGAILIIAFIYSTGIGIKWVLAACLAILVIVGFSKFGFVHPLFYIVLGIFLWYFIYRSGIHATLAGVILGLLTPNIAKTRSGTIDVEDGEVSIIEWLEDKLHPWTSLLIVPIFAFANTGVEISTDALQRAINSHIAWGIICGLVAGKPLGIFFSIILARKLRIGSFPEGASKGGLFATGSAAGIGFTVAIFIAQLAFREKASQEIAIMAVIIASITSGLVSFISFKLFARRTTQNIQ